MWSLLWMGGTKTCSNGPGHMTKMATMPYMIKSFKNLIRWNGKAVDLETWYSSTTKFVQVIPLVWPWPILRQGQFRSPMLLYGKKLKQTSNLMIWENYLFEKNCVFDFSKLALVCRMQISGAWHAVHAIAEMEWVHSSVTIATRTFRLIPNIPLLWSYQAIEV